MKPAALCLFCTLLLSGCQSASEVGFRAANRAIENGFIITLFVYHF